MSGSGRVLVHVQRARGGPVEPVQFTSCLLQLLGGAGTGSARVAAPRLAGDRLVLGPADPAGVLLQHPPFCPVLQLGQGGGGASLSSAVAGRGVGVGVVTLLETTDRQLLLTRRGRHMRTFPGVWVPPGGHIELGETLLEAGARECWEETGLQVLDCLSSWRVLCLWESVFPYRLELGSPQRHHLVIYLLLSLTASQEELQPGLRLDPGEVEAAMWLDSNLARLVGGDSVQADSPATVEAWQLGSGAELERVQIPAQLLTSQAPAGGPDIERISTGTRYAVKQWLDQLQTLNL